jgi:hypothetical protein
MKNGLSHAIMQHSRERMPLIHVELAINAHEIGNTPFDPLHFVQAAMPCNIGRFA